jgi:hypothetical protein
MSTIETLQLTEASSFVPCPHTNIVLSLAEAVIKSAEEVSFKDREDFVNTLTDRLMPVYDDEVWNCVVQLGLYDSPNEEAYEFSTNDPTRWARYVLYRTVSEIVEIYAVMIGI